ncbi:MAG: DUF3494 domain-containing protein [Gemmatimonadales bacterium]|nr:MAG: DUF3494 domain-containing protein [Gemmatimonadales bacterium]
MERLQRVLRSPFPAARWIVAAALVALTSVACDVHSPSGPGDVASLSLTPTQTTMVINGTQQLVVRAFDAEGREVSLPGPGGDASTSWQMLNGGGTVTSDGVFHSGTQLGTFTNTVRVSRGGAEAFASFTVIAGAAAAIVVTPNPDTLGVGATSQFTAAVVDAGGNPIPATPAWTVVNGGGEINSATGAFTAGMTAGTFTNTVRASSGALSGFATVTVLPSSSPITITMMPNPAEMGVNSTQQFIATAVDGNGDTIAITPVWSVEEGGGTIVDSTGVFTSGETLGTFTNTVMATSGNVSGTATVEVTTTPPPSTGIFGSAAPNGIMAGTEVTCVSLGLIDADVSIHPGNTVTGYPPCTITGAQNLGNELAEQMQVDLTTAYNTLADLPCPPGNVIAANLGGTTLPAGVYCSETEIGVTGTLTLDGGGDPDAEFVFQAGSSLTTAGDIVLINEAQAQNVFWQVGSSATLGTASSWQGNIVALTSITLVDTATLLGRALAREGAVSLGTGNIITLP